MVCPGFMLPETSSATNSPVHFLRVNDTPLFGLGGLVATYDEVADLLVETILDDTGKCSNMCVGIATGEQYWGRLLRGMWTYYRPGLFT
jgi:hypothetical protein